jgi:hypothetical protein
VSPIIEFALGGELSSDLTTDIAVVTSRMKPVITRWDPPVIIVALSSLYVLQVLLGLACLNALYYTFFIAPFLFQDMPRQGGEGIL